MTIQRSVASRNAQLDAHETTVGTDPILKIRSGSQPATCASADSGTAGVSMTLPTDWLAAAASGAKAKSGTWSAAASTGITAGHYRIYDSTGTTCHEQGSVTATGGGGDLTLETVTIVAGQTVTITGYTLTAGMA